MLALQQQNLRTGSDSRGTDVWRVTVSGEIQKRKKSAEESSWEAPL